MRKIFFCFLYLSFCSVSFCQQKFQLGRPLMQYRSAFFTDTALLEIRFEQQGTKIHFTRDGNNPTVNDAPYTKPIVIKDKITTVKAAAFGANFLPSDVAAITFIKDGLTVKAIHSTNPDDRYGGNGANALIDNSGGFAESSAKTWLGFKNDTVAIEIELKNIVPVKQVLLNFLRDEGSWIFLPEAINVYAYDYKKKQYSFLNNDLPFNGKASSGSSNVYRIISTGKKIKTDKLLVQIITLKKIPEWHEANGNHTWMFIDELKVY